MPTTKRDSYPPVWDGPSLAELRALESTIDNLRQAEPEVSEALSHWLRKGDIARAETEQSALNELRMQRDDLEAKLAALTARAAAEGLLILDYCDTFARPLARHGEYLLMAAPDRVIARIGGGRWRGIDVCEWINPTHETITDSWSWIVKTVPVDRIARRAVETTAEPAIAAYREHESRYEKGVTLRHEWRVRAVDDIPDETLDMHLGAQWRYLHPGTTHVVEERALRAGQPSTIWTVTFAIDSYEQAAECIDSGAVIVCPILREVHERHEQAQRERMAELAEQAERERLEAEEQAEREARAARSDAAFERMASSKSGAVWAERWNAFTRGATSEQRETWRKNAEFVRLHDAVIAAETVPTKRKAIRECLAYADLTLRASDVRTRGRD